MPRCRIGTTIIDALKLCYMVNVEDLKISRRTRDGIHGTLLKGRWPNKAPRGYKNVNNGDRDKYVAIDEPKAKLVRYAFEEVAKGTKTPTLVWREVQRKGLKVSESSFFEMLRNHFYCGEVYVPEYLDEPAQYVKGVHEPLMSLDEIPIELNKAMDAYFNEWQFIRRDMKVNISVDDVVIVEGDTKCSVSIREGFIDELRDSMTREVSTAELEDTETFRKAIHLLWSLADKGYKLSDSLAIALGQQPVFVPSLIDRLMATDAVNNKNGRDNLITDERLLNELHK